MNKNNYRFDIIAIIFLMVFIAYCTPNSAQNEISDSILLERIHGIQNSMNHNEVNTKRWWYGWLTGYSATTVVQGAIGFLSDSKTTRQDMGLGAITTSIGAIGQFITPIVPENKADSLSRFPEISLQNKLVKLHRAEEMLKEAALKEKEARTWQIHAISGAVNLSSGLITWLGFKRTVWDGVTNFALNTLVSEVQIWSTPTRAMKDYRIYCRKYILSEKQLINTNEPKWFVAFYPGKVQIKLVF
jgi:hypothetical protein